MKGSHPHLSHRKKTRKASAKTAKPSSATLSDLKRMNADLLAGSDEDLLRRVLHEMEMIPPAATPKKKLAAIKKAIADGTYHVEAEKIAERIIEEHLGPPRRTKR